MMIVNIVLAVALLGFVGMGAKDGFVHTVGRAIGSVLGFFAARAWSSFLVPYVGIVIPLPWASFVAFLLIFGAVNRLAGYALKFIDGAVGVISVIPFVKSGNKFMGGLVGFFEGIIILGGSIYILLVYRPSPQLLSYIAPSVVAQWLHWAFLHVLGFLL